MQVHIGCYRHGQYFNDVIPSWHNNPFPVRSAPIGERRTRRSSVVYLLYNLALDTALRRHFISASTRRATPVARASNERLAPVCLHRYLLRHGLVAALGQAERRVANR